MHKLKVLCPLVVSCFIYVKGDEYHKLGAKCYILNFNRQARYNCERATVNCIIICSSTLFPFIFKCFSDVRKELPLNHRK